MKPSLQYLKACIQQRVNLTRSVSKSCSTPHHKQSYKNQTLMSKYSVQSPIFKAKHRHNLSNPLSQRCKQFYFDKSKMQSANIKRPSTAVQKGLNKRSLLFRVHNNQKSSDKFDLKDETEQSLIKQGWNGEGKRKCGKTKKVNSCRSNIGNGKIDRNQVEDQSQNKRSILTSTLNEPTQVTPTDVISRFPTPKQQKQGGFKKDGYADQTDFTNQNQDRAFSIPSFKQNAQDQSHIPLLVETNITKKQIQREILQEDCRGNIVRFSEESKDSKAFRTAHHNVTCKSQIKTLGDGTLNRYLQEMKNTDKRKQVIMKNVQYYPLKGMQAKAKLSQQYESDYIARRAAFQQGVKYFDGKIKVQENFRLNQFFNENSDYVNKVNQGLLKSENATQNKSKFGESKFKSPSKQQKQSKGDGSLQKNKFLLKYELILTVNCQNKRYFSYDIQKVSDNTSFFKYTIPLLDDPPQTKQNRQSLDSERQNLSLYFNCLINSKENIREGFFWIGKPIQYYRKERLIDAIDSFLVAIKGLHVFESQNIWIVDFQGRNSFINKSNLKGALSLSNSEAVQSPQNPYPNSKINNLSRSSLKRMSDLMSRRMSKSMGRKSDSTANSFTMETFLSSWGQQQNTNDSFLLKKKKSNISTHGDFKLIYE